MEISTQPNHTKASLSMIRSAPAHLFGHPLTGLIIIDLFQPLTPPATAVRDAQHVPRCKKHSNKMQWCVPADVSS